MRRGPFFRGRRRIERGQPFGRRMLGKAVAPSLPSSFRGGSAPRHPVQERIPAMIFIFDCDGVLVDSEILAARVDSELLTKAGYPITPEEVIQRFAGLTAEAFMRIVTDE